MEDADARKGRKVAKHYVFPMICGPGGSKSRLAKAAGAEPAGQMRDEKVHAVVARSTFPSQNAQSTSVSDRFWKLGCRKSARSCGAKHIRSQNAQSTPFSDHFWKLRCRKSAHRCGAKHISKSTCIKHLSVGPLLEVQMSKKCTPLWHEAHFEVKMLKAFWVRTTCGGSDVASLRFSTLHYITLHSTTLHYTTLHYTTLQLQLHNYTPLYSTKLNYTTLQRKFKSQTSDNMDR